jgi:hypothetical protein
MPYPVEEVVEPDLIEKEREVKFTVTMRYFGRAAHATELHEILDRELKLQFGNDKISTKRKKAKK